MADGGQSIAELAHKRRTRAMACLLVYLRHGGDPSMAEAEVLKYLTETERQALLSLMIGSFPVEEAAKMCRAWFAGSGVPEEDVFQNHDHTASVWVNTTTDEEKRAYFKAIFRAMSPEMQARSLKWAGSKRNA